MVRGFRDRDYVETVDNLFFAVIGNTHPKDRVLAYLKYLPDPRGKWGKKGKKFRRSIRYYSATSIMRTVNFLRKRYPEYLFRDEQSDISFSAVPVEKIVKHHRPEDRLEEIRRAEHPDRLERRTVELTSLLSEQSGVSLRRLGVTGSILIGVQTSFSDIDAIVYGASESRRIKKTLLSLYHSKGSGLRRFTGHTLSQWCKEQSSVHPLTIDETKALYTRTWNKGLYENIIFSIHPVRIRRNEHFGEQFFKSKGIVEVNARVVDSSDAFFLPATYRVTDVHPDFNKLDRVVSYEGLYSGIASKNDEMVVRGKLEEVFDRFGKMKYRRILVGSAEARASDFIKVKD